jgi:hypothetical protein
MALYNKIPLKQGLHTVGILSSWPVSEIIFEKWKTSLVLIKRNAQTFLSRATLNEAGPLITFCK